LPQPPQHKAAAVRRKLARMTKRRDFVRATNSPVCVKTPAFVMQAACNNLPQSRFGFTASAKVGGAVVRNRCKRRLREVVRLHLAQMALPGTDYVLIARQATASYPFQALVRDALKGMEKCAKSLSQQ